MAFSNDQLDDVQRAFLTERRKISAEQVFISVRELAKMLGVSVRTVRRMQARGALPPRIKRGRSLAYHAADVKALIATQAGGKS